MWVIARSPSPPTIGATVSHCIITIVFLFIATISGELKTVIHNQLSVSLNPSHRGDCYRHDGGQYRSSDRSRLYCIDDGQVGSWQAGCRSVGQSTGVQTEPPPRGKTKNLSPWSLGHALPLRKISSKSVHNFVSYPTDRQTDRQTDPSEYITSFFSGGNDKCRPKFNLVEGALSEGGFVVHSVLSVVRSVSHLMSVSHVYIVGCR